MIHLKEKKIIMLFKRVALPFFGCLGVLSLHCSQPVERSVATEYRDGVSNLIATIDQTSVNVRLSWVAPVSKPDFYIISKERPGFSSIIQVRIGGDVIGYTDVIDVSTGDYKYKVVPFKIVQSEIGADTIQGIPSSVVSVTIGKTVSFSINNGAASTSNAQVVLNLLDKSAESKNKVASVRFTQIIRTVLIKEASATQKKDTVSFEYNDPAHIMTSDSLKKLIDNGYINNDGILTPPSSSGSVIKKYIPVFDSADGINNPDHITMGAAAEANTQWQLLPGNGTKRVFAEVTYVDGTKNKDTLTSEIAIAAYRITIRMKNTVNSNDAEMKQGSSDTANNTNKTPYFLNKPIVRFSVSIDGDATFSETFYYWIAVLNKKGTIDEIPSSGTDSTTAWIETAPEMGKLTGGGGVLHDEGHVYEYDLNPLSTAGKQHLEKLQYTTKGAFEHIAERTFPFRLSGEEHFNEFAIPGKYWGNKPFKLLPSKAMPTIIPCDSVITDTPEPNYSRLMALTNSSKNAPGVKEFVIVLCFKGKEFNDTRTIWSGGNGYASRNSIEPVSDKYNRTFFDFLPPGALPITSRTNPFFLTNGDTVSTVFTFKLTSLEDKGQGRITEAKLIIAQMPIDFVWDYTKFTPDTDLPVSLAQMFLMKHTIVPYRIAVPSVFLENIQWNDIDPTIWQSGRYLLGVITRDEWGNEGLASFNFNTDVKLTNPFMIHVVSGR